MTPLRIGFIPLLDCAAFAVAEALGFAADEGLELRLVRETSWANIRDRVVVGHFDAAHMLGPMTVASTLGIGHVTVPLVAPLALGLGGNAVTFSTALADALRPEGAVPGDPPALQGHALARVVGARAKRGDEPLTFGMVYPFSCHNYELRYWLAACGVDPDRDVRLVVIPPSLLVDAMREGQIDGFCVGEPWNSVAVDAGVGSLAFAGSAIWASSPEKVLGCRLDWAERNPGALDALVRALYRACAWCEQETNHRALASLLAAPAWIDAPAEVIERGLAGRLRLSRQGPEAAWPGFFIPASGFATFPWTSHARWFYSQMVRWGQAPWSSEMLDAATRTYRPDLHRRALAPLGIAVPSADSRVEGGVLAASIHLDRAHGFFDGVEFDASDLAAYLGRLPRFPNATC